MARVKRGVPAHRRHKAILDRAKGFRLSKKLLFRPANEAVLHALAYAFRDRRRRKREMRRLWIARINAVPPVGAALQQADARPSPGRSGDRPQDAG